MQRIKEILTDQKKLIDNTKKTIKEDREIDILNFTLFFLEIYANNLELTSRVNHLLNIKED